MKMLLKHKEKCKDVNKMQRLWHDKINENYSSIATTLHTGFYEQNNQLNQ